MSKLQELRKVMKESGIDTYIVTKFDPHQSEHSHQRFNGVEFLSGFTGSQGTLVITQKEAGLWTDNRYYLQASMELSPEFTLFKESEPETVSYLNYAANAGGFVAFDGKAFSAAQGKKLIRQSKNSKIEHKDFLDKIWENRPDFQRNELINYGIKYCGQTSAKKIAKVREEMLKKKASVYLISSRDDIAWLFNIRCLEFTGAFNFLAYAAVTPEETLLFMDTTEADKEVLDTLKADGVLISPYEDFYEYLKETDNVLIAPTRTNYYTFSRLKGKKITEIPFDITSSLKAVKNQTELENIRTAQLKEGLVYTRLIKQIKTQTPGNEYDIYEKMLEIRKDTGYLGLAFNPIIAYGENGAIVHYRTAKESAKAIEPQGFVLLDIGCNYIEGTTDISRTVALGSLTDDMKKHYTYVLKAYIAFETLKFPFGMSGIHLDAIAKNELWKHGLTYGHGTGHGIGHLLNVHEGPQNVSVRFINAPLQENVLLSDEPGCYIEGEYGIRIENNVRVIKAEKTPQAQFLAFENLTFVPLEKDAVLPELLTDKEKEWYNNYQAQVYEKLKDELTEEERQWLKEVTEAV